jgi:tetratricopeptide (TPR) repeat protein
MTLALVFIVTFDRTYSDNDLHLKTIQNMKMESIKKDLQLAIKDYEIRTLNGSKSNRTPASAPSLAAEIQSNRLFSALKNYHQHDDCVNVLEVFKQIQANYSFAPFFPEALILKADCQMQMKEYEQALVTYSGLIDMYPDHIATGHGILKMAEILRLLDRPSEAFEALKVIKVHFQDYPEIIRAANEMAIDMGRSL